MSGSVFCSFRSLHTTQSAVIRAGFGSTVIEFGIASATSSTGSANIATSTRLLEAFTESIALQAQLPGISVSNREVTVLIKAAISTFGGHQTSPRCWARSSCNTIWRFPSRSPTPWRTPSRRRAFSRQLLTL